MPRLSWTASNHGSRKSSEEPGLKLTSHRDGPCRAIGAHGSFSQVQDAVKYLFKLRGLGDIAIFSPYSLLLHAVR